MGRDYVESGVLRGSSRFIMPRPCLGQIVVWRFNPSSEPSAAVVTKIGGDSLALLVHVDSVKDHLLRTGVRHVTDPWLAKFPAHEGGCWDFTDWDKLVMDHLGISLGVRGEPEE